MLDGIGDVNSNAKGSGARYNADKPDLAQIPLAQWCVYFAGTKLVPEFALDILKILSDKWQLPSGYRSHGDLEEMWVDVIQTIPPDAMRSAARVFSYGARKYAQWNWTKGMDWSIPVACALRHLLALTEREYMDDESGEHHIGHFVCNILMLAWFQEFYPEGQGWIIMEDIEDVA